MALLFRWLVLSIGWRIISPASAFAPKAQPRRSLDTTALRISPFEASMYDPEDNEQNRIDKSDQTFVVGVNKYTHDTAICVAHAETGNVVYAAALERLERRKHAAGNIGILVEEFLNDAQIDVSQIQRVVVNNHHHRVLPLEQRDLAALEWEEHLMLKNGHQAGSTDPENLLPHTSESSSSSSSSNCCEHWELSHHLAHAYSTAAQAPMDRGLIIVMDGMGETLRTLMSASQSQNIDYISDFHPAITANRNDIQLVPADVMEQCQNSVFDWREAESAYTFRKDNDSGGLTIAPIFKRFTPEHTPPALGDTHGFEDMDSLGAVYSRASSHLFGDWNTCGKVMGLAPWYGKLPTTENEESEKETDETGTNETESEVPPIFQGSLWDSNKPLQINRTILQGVPLTARQDPDLFDEEGERKLKYNFDNHHLDPAMLEQRNSMNSNLNNPNQPAPPDTSDSTERRLPLSVDVEAVAIAHRIQTDLETVVLDWVRHLRETVPDEYNTNLCLAGGVALNSVLNGKLAREVGFDQTFVSPYPGDDGIAVGCCAYGLFGPTPAADTDNDNDSATSEAPSSSSPPVWTQPITPYLGSTYSDADLKAAIEDVAPWLTVEAVRSPEQRVRLAADEIASGGVVAWYQQARSEMGPRALGHRSLLADPRKIGLVRFINQHVKRRESFRPFAPSVLAEHAHEWFDLVPEHKKTDDDADSDSDPTSDYPNVSPFMSLTAMVKNETISQLIPAVTHVDGSSRLQTVTPEDEPLYHQLIRRFHEITGIPMVLNTSFNTIPGEPIVETPQDAIRSFLFSMGAIEMLVLGDYVITRKSPQVSDLLGSRTKKGDIVRESVCPVRTGPVTFRASFVLDQEHRSDDESEEGPDVTTEVRMPDRPIHMASKNNAEGWFPLIDELEGEVLSLCDGETTVNDMMARYAPMQLEEGESMTPELADDAKLLVENIVQRLIRLHEHTFISW